MQYQVETIKQIFMCRSDGKRFLQGEGAFSEYILPSNIAYMCDQYMVLGGNSWVSAAHLNCELQPADQPRNIKHPP